MKIQSGNPNLANRGEVSQSKSTNPTDIANLGSSQKKSVAASAIADSTKVNVSQNARDINKIKTAAHSAPDVDAAKVAHFKELIQSGKYNIDSDAIAGKMLDEEEWVGSLAKS